MSTTLWPPSTLVNGRLLKKSQPFGKLPVFRIYPSHIMRPIHKHPVVLSLGTACLVHRSALLYLEITNSVYILFFKFHTFWGVNNRTFILPHITDSSEDYCARLWLIVCKRFSHLVVEFRLWRRKCNPGGEWVEYFNNFLFSTLFAPLRCGNPLQYLLCSPFAVANRLWTQRPLLRSLEQQIRSKMLLRRRSCRHGR